MASIFSWHSFHWEVGISLSEFGRACECFNQSVMAEVIQCNFQGLVRGGQAASIWSSWKLTPWGSQLPWRNLCVLRPPCWRSHMQVQGEELLRTDSHASPAHGAFRWGSPQPTTGCNYVKDLSWELPSLAQPKYLAYTVMNHIKYVLFYATTLWSSLLQSIGYQNNYYRAK